MPKTYEWTKLDTDWHYVTINDRLFFRATMFLKSKLVDSKANTKWHTRPGTVELADVWNCAPRSGWVSCPWLNRVKFSQQLEVSLVLYQQYAQTDRASEQAGRCKEKLTSGKKQFYGMGSEWYDHWPHKSGADAQKTLTKSQMCTSEVHVLSYQVHSKLNFGYPQLCSVIRELQELNTTKGNWLYLSRTIFNLVAPATSVVSVRLSIHEQVGPPPHTHTPSNRTSLWSESQHKYQLGTGCWQLRR